MLTKGLLFAAITQRTISSIHMCSEEGQCHSKTITCTPDESCFVECTKNYACYGTTVQCPANHLCSIKCYYPSSDIANVADSGQRICQNMQIIATDSSLLTVEASMGDTYHLLPYPRTMEGATIYCPHNNRFAADLQSVESLHNHSQIEPLFPCQIFCDGDDVMRNLEIYAVEGMNDVYIESHNYTRPWCLRSAELHCGLEYDLRCTLSNRAPFECHNAYFNPQHCDSYIVSTTSSTSTTSMTSTTLSTSSTSSSSIPTAVTVQPTGSPTVSFNTSSIPSTSSTTINTKSPTVHPTEFQFSTTFTTMEWNTESMESTEMTEEMKSTELTDPETSTTENEGKIDPGNNRRISVTQEIILIIAFMVLFCLPIMVCWFMAWRRKQRELYRPQTPSRNYSQIPKEHMYDERERMTITETHEREQEEDMEIRYSENALFKGHPIHEVMTPLKQSDLDSDDEVVESMVHSVPKILDHTHRGQRRELPRVHTEWMKYQPGSATSLVDTTTIRMRLDDDDDSISTIDSS